MFDDLLDGDATNLAAHIRHGEVSALEITRAALDRMESRDGQIHAFCTPTPAAGTGAGRGGRCPAGAR